MVGNYSVQLRMKSVERWNSNLNNRTGKSDNVLSWNTATVSPSKSSRCPTDLWRDGQKNTLFPFIGAFETEWKDVRDILFASYSLQEEEGEEEQKTTERKRAGRSWKIVERKVQESGKKEEKGGV